MKHEVFGYNLEQREKPISISAPIEAAKFNEVKKSQDICTFALVIEERFQLGLDNFHEWETELLEQAQKSLIWNINDFATAMQQRLDLDRRFVNLLSSLRLYLDQSDHNISQVFGEDSEEVKGVKKFKCQLYDKHFGYRLIEALRNHVQHSDLPLSTIRYNSSRVESQDGVYVQFSVVPQISLEALSENKKFKKNILEELQANNKYIDLRHSAREFIYCLTMLHAEIRGVFRGLFSSSRATYEKAIEEFSKIDDKKLEHVKLVAFEDDGQRSDQVELVTEFLKLYDALHAKNSKVIDIRRSFASNALHKN